MTRNRLIGDEPVRGFESHRLRHIGASGMSLAPIFLLISESGGTDTGESLAWYSLS